MTFVRHIHGGPFRFGPPGFRVNGGHPVLGPLLLIAILAVVVWALVLLTRYVNHRYVRHTDHGHSPGTGGSSDALTILNERFARGEIDADEFTQRRTLLLQPR